MRLGHDGLGLSRGHQALEYVGGQHEGEEGLTPVPEGALFQLVGAFADDTDLRRS